MQTQPQRGIEEAALLILDVIIEHHGHFDRGEPGEVLGNLAAEAGVPYKVASMAVLYLERIELVAVERLTHPTHARANRIVAVEAY